MCSFFSFCKDSWRFCGKLKLLIAKISVKSLDFQVLNLFLSLLLSEFNGESLQVELDTDDDDDAKNKMNRFRESNNYLNG